MLRKFPSKNTQFHRARLISPYFDFLRHYEPFLKDIERIRDKYCSRNTEKESEKVPLILLYQEFWDPNNESMQVVLTYGNEFRSIWKEFHLEIESLATNYRLKKFPNLIKEFILNNRFWDLLFKYWMVSEDESFNLRISRTIKKEEFVKIWDLIQEYNSQYPVNRSIYGNYSDEILEKYSYVEEIKRKYHADQKDIILLIKKELDKWMNQDIEWKIAWWDKSRKSRLNKIVKELFSLIDDLADADK